MNRVNLTDAEISATLEALNDSFHFADSKLKEAANPLAEAIYTQRKELCLAVIRKLEEL